MSKKDNYMVGDDLMRYWCSILEHQREVCRGAAIPENSKLHYGKDSVHRPTNYGNLDRKSDHP